MLLFQLEKTKNQGEMFPVKEKPQTDSKNAEANQPQYEVDREDQELEE